LTGQSHESLIEVAIILSPVCSLASAKLANL
jgi:hypothetical protein